MKRAKLVILALLAVLLPVAVGSPAGANSGQEATYTVTYTNLTDAQYLTPPNFAAHASSVQVFDRGVAASVGVQAVAENGGVGVLAGELTTAIDDAGLGVSGVGAAAAIGPGQSVTFEFTTSESRLSLVSMLICTNDGFAGLDSGRLPKHDGQTKMFRLMGYDAGTEINTEIRSDLVPAPFCGEGPGSTMSNPDLAEDGVVHPHRTLKGIGDLDPALDWAGPVARLTVTRS
jgi:hypothetical protein